MITDRQTHTHTQTDTLITILRSPIAVEYYIYRRHVLARECLTIWNEIVPKFVINDTHIFS